MIKNKLDKRREYVKSVVNDSPKPTETVKELSETLFLSERTIWKDLQE